MKTVVRTYTKKYAIKSKPAPRRIWDISGTMAASTAPPYREYVETSIKSDFWIS